MSTAPITAPDTPKNALKGASAAWTAAVIIIALCLIATFTLRTPAASNNVASGSGSHGRGISAGGSAGDGGDQGDVSGDAAAGSAGSDVAGSGSAAGVGGAGGRGGSGGSGGGSGKAGANGIINVAGADCAHGKNAGWHDETGVSPTEIKFAATTVTTGIARDFLADAQYGIEAVKSKVNRNGGICGRQITIDYRNDGWDQAQGQGFISDFIGEKKYFGLAVNPSSEGLRGALDGGSIDSAKFPVVGADGMLQDQYSSKHPWVWPVATSTASVMHIMADEAVARGAKSYGIVWDGHYRFGQEGHDAFVAEFARKCGGCPKGGSASDYSIDGSTQPDFSSQANNFMGDCGGTSFSKCDFVAMLLEPAAATTWVTKDHGLGDGHTHPKYAVGVPQPLFVNSFVHACASYCSNMYAWTSFKPPLSPFDGEGAVRTYQADLRSVSQSADATNPHVEGAYVGMLLLVDALTKLGAAPTRDGIKQVLDSTSLDTGLTPTPITFKPGNHYGSIGAQAFEDLTGSNGAFANWRYHPETSLTDGHAGQDVTG